MCKIATDVIATNDRWPGKERLRESWTGRERDKGDAEWPGERDGVEERKDRSYEQEDEEEDKKQHR